MRRLEFRTRISIRSQSEPPSNPLLAQSRRGRALSVSLAMHRCRVSWKKKRREKGEKREEAAKIGRRIVFMRPGKSLFASMNSRKGHRSVNRNPRSSPPLIAGPLFIAPRRLRILRGLLTSQRRQGGDGNQPPSSIKSPIDQPIIEPSDTLVTCSTVRTGVRTYYAFPECTDDVRHVTVRHGRWLSMLRIELPWTSRFSDERATDRARE